MGINKLTQEEREWVKAIVTEVMEVHMLSCPYGKEVTKVKWMLAGALAMGVFIGALGQDIGVFIKSILGV